MPQPLVGLLEPLPKLRQGVQLLLKRVSPRSDAKQPARANAARSRAEWPVTTRRHPLRHHLHHRLHL